MKRYTLWVFVLILFAMNVHSADQTTIKSLSDPRGRWAVSYRKHPEDSVMSAHAILLKEKTTKKDCGLKGLFALLTADSEHEQELYYFKKHFLPNIQLYIIEKQPLKQAVCNARTKTYQAFAETASKEKKKEMPDQSQANLSAILLALYSKQGYVYTFNHDQPIDAEPNDQKCHELKARFFFLSMNLPSLKENPPAEFFHTTDNAGTRSKKKVSYSIDNADPDDEYLGGTAVMCIALNNVCR